MFALSKKITLPKPDIYQEYHAGKPISQLAEKYNVSRTTIRNRIREFEKEIIESPRQEELPPIEDSFEPVVRKRTFWSRLRDKIRSLFGWW